MNKRTLKALKGSIKKWDDIAERGGVDRGEDNCPLCKAFKDLCDPCPVKMSTGKYQCRGTPYSDFTECAEDQSSNSWLEIANAATSPTAKKHARRMRDYLISLLPEGETWP